MGREMGGGFRMGNTSCGPSEGKIEVGEGCQGWTGQGANKLTVMLWCVWKTKLSSLLWSSDSHRACGMGTEAIPLNRLPSHCPLWSI